MDVIAKIGHLHIGEWSKLKIDVTMAGQIMKLGVLPYLLIMSLIFKMK